MEAPHLTRLAREHAESGLVVLAVNVWGADRASVQRFADENKLKHKILLDPDEKVWGGPYPAMIPVTYWIDREGVIRDFELGFDGPEKFEKKTKWLLARG